MDLKQSAEQLLVQMIEKATQAGDFIAEQMPLVIQELLMYNFVYCLVMFLAGLVVIVLAMYYGIKGVSYGIRENDPDVLFPTVFMMIVVILPSFFGLINLTWLKIWLAPRVYLIEYAAQLVK